ncbi:unnamed protein product [Knipowitschia caucasica]|uniref:G-protein coupled receptors family 1 profile domain-containing protein n=1 Tax=Knipowitschia caucasica TaxID=637954 RepID=A0AAV2MI92_KNICA
MSACRTVFILMLCVCAWTAELRDQSPVEEAVQPGTEEQSGTGVQRFQSRVERGVKGSWRERSSVDPGLRFFTPAAPTPPSPRRVNASLRASLLPLSGGAPWALALLMLAVAVMCVGVGAALALMCLVWNSLQLQSAWNCVLAAHALWDFIVLCVCVPVEVTHQLTSTRILPALSCGLAPFLQVSSMGVATFSLCALSIDRFHSATSPASLSARMEPCASILPKVSVVFVGALLLAAPELLLHRGVRLPLEEGGGNYTQLDVCLPEPAPELPLAVLSLVLTYQEARCWWVLGCYLLLPLLFTLSCDLVTRRVMSQRAELIGRQESSSRSPSPSDAKKDLSRSPSPSASVNRKLVEQEAMLRSVICALIGLYCACSLPEALCDVALIYAPALGVTSLSVGVAYVPVSVASMPALRLIGQFLLYVRCSATPLLALVFSRALGRAFVRCCCCCCEDCGEATTVNTPTLSLATPSTLLATPLSAVASPIRQQGRGLGTPC